MATYIAAVVVQTVLEQGGSFAGINRKVQIKPLKWSQPEEGSTEEPRVTEALLILKHGGVLTHAGRQQACLSSSLTHLLAYLPTYPLTCWTFLHTPYSLACLLA